MHSGREILLSRICKDFEFKKHIKKVFCRASSNGYSRILVCVIMGGLRLGRRVSLLGGVLSMTGTRSTLGAGAGVASFAHGIQHRLAQPKLALIKACLLAGLHHGFNEQRGHLLALLARF